MNDHDSSQPSPPRPGPLFLITGPDLLAKVVSPGWVQVFGDAAPCVGDPLRAFLPREFVAALFGETSWPTQRFDAITRENAVTEFEAVATREGDIVVVALTEIGAGQESSASAARGPRFVRDLLLRDGGIGTWVYDPDTQIYNFPPELHRLAQITSKAVRRMPGSIPLRVMESFYHPDDLPLARELRDRVTTEAGAAEFELRVSDPKRPGWNHLRILMRSGRRLASGRYEMVGLTQDVTELARARDEARINAERAQTLAETDPLTGLANRAIFDARLQAAAAAERRGSPPAALLCLDLDGFKTVNDTLGHQAGDELLQIVAQRLRSQCRAGDVVARLGGDEFAIIQNNADPAAAESFARRIAGRLRDHVELKAGAAKLSCSLGVTLIGSHGGDHVEALRQADLALYRAKAQGGGRHCFFEPAMDAALQARTRLAADLAAAVEVAAIAIAYQPIVRADGGIVGVEALARWTHSERGEIPPSIFIPLAEETGLIGALGVQAFRRVCEDVRAWPELRVSVNVAPAQIRRGDLVSSLKVVLEETGADPARFDLEITEGSLLLDDAATQTVLRELRALGFQLSLDDFGTGFSSLSYLHKYPIDKIKLDRSFISRLDSDHEAVAILRAIVQLAQALKLGLIAEGVETVRQRDLLASMGVETFQGFLFSPAVPPHELEAMLRGASRAAACPAVSGHLARSDRRRGRG